jgi:hypothetical protein
MGVILVIVFILFVVAMVVVPIFVVTSRRTARERKNFERGLKMVPLLIHLPPISEDIDGNGRDTRDILDENISKGQIIYNIIASTYEKGFKRRLYGQQHLAFEIVSSQGFIYFYATVPIGLVDVVSQAIVSAYPAARLEEAEEHNIFSSVGKTSGTTGGELVLKESFAYPIATYVDLKRDAMQSILNSMSTAGKEDGAAIQILIRPADPGWRRAAHTVASDKRKGKDSNGAGKAAMGFAKDIGTAFYKAPEAKGDKGDDKPNLSDHEQEMLNAIDDKTRYPAYEVLIRLVASSNVSQRSQTLLNNMVASFSVFDAPGKNGFKYEPAKDVESLISSYTMRFFPQDKNKSILNSVELATIFHFPDQRSIPTTQLERQDSKQVDGPRNMPDTGLLLGYNVFRGVKKPIRLALHDRQRHMYVVGQTGTGKSTFLENLALQDMMDGNGFAFVDPHGDTAEKLLSMVPKERTEDVIYFCPADMDYPMGLNLFEFQSPDQKDFLIQEALNMLKKLYDPNNQGIMGPRYEHLFRNAALTVMADPAGGTFIDIPKLFRDPQYVKQKLEFVKDPNVLEFWQKEMPQSQRSNEFGEVVSWFVSKFGAFLSNEMMRNIIGQTKSAFDLRDIMDNKKILLVNLSKGRTGDLNSKLLGMFFVMKFQAAAMSRANIPESERVDFSLYVDEFQNFSTDSFATIMSEARKYHLNLIVANQFTTQLTEEIRDAVFGNMGTIVAFRIGQNDVESLSRYFQPIFDGDDLLRVPNYNTIVRTLTGGVPTQPFSMATLPPLGNPNTQLSDALKQLSAAKFGRPKLAIEKEIMERIATKEAPVPTGPVPAAGGFGAGAAPRPGFGQAPTANPGAGGAGARPFGASPWQQPAAGLNNVSARTAAGGFGAGTGTAAWQPQPAPMAASASAPRPASSGSFLDDWLTKRGSSGSNDSNSAPTPTPVSQPAIAPVTPAPTPVPAPVAPVVPTPTPMSPPAAPKPADPVVPPAITPEGTSIATLPSNPAPTPALPTASEPTAIPSVPKPSVDTPTVRKHTEAMMTKKQAEDKTEEPEQASKTEERDEVDEAPGTDTQEPKKKRRRRGKKHKTVEPPEHADKVATDTESETTGLDREQDDLKSLQQARAEHQQHEAEKHNTDAAQTADRPISTIESKPKVSSTAPELATVTAKEESTPKKIEDSDEPYKPIEPKLMSMPVVNEPSVSVSSEDATAKAKAMLEAASLRPQSPMESDLSHGDTIYIDQEGNLKLVDKDAESEAAKKEKETTAATDSFQAKRDV